MRDYADDEYDDYVYECMERTGGLPFIGIYGSEPEISFHCEDRKTMLTMAKDFNQLSVWDVKKGEEIPNPHYNWKTNPIERRNKPR